MYKEPLPEMKIIDKKPGDIMKELESHFVKNAVRDKELKLKLKEGLNGDIKYILDNPDLSRDAKFDGFQQIIRTFQRKYDELTKPPSYVSNSAKVVQLSEEQCKIWEEREKKGSLTTIKSESNEEMKFFENLYREGHQILGVDKKNKWYDITPEGLEENEELMEWRKTWLILLKYEEALKKELLGPGYKACIYIEENTEHDDYYKDLELIKKEINKNVKK